MDCVHVHGRVHVHFLIPCLCSSPCPCQQPERSAEGMIKMVSILERNLNWHILINVLFFLHNFDVQWFRYEMTAAFAYSVSLIWPSPIQCTLIWRSLIGRLLFQCSLSWCWLIGHPLIWCSVILLLLIWWWLIRRSLIRRFAISTFLNFNKRVVYILLKWAYAPPPPQRMPPSCDTPVPLTHTFCLHFLPFLITFYNLCCLFPPLFSFFAHTSHFFPFL